MFSREKWDIYWLQRKVKKIYENENKIKNVVPLGPILSIFSEKEEDELVGYLLDIEILRRL